MKSADQEPASASLERARRCFEERAWAAAYDGLALADRSGALNAEDLERFAVSAYLLGRDDEYLTLLQRAFHAHCAAQARARAARAAFWLGLRLLFRGEPGHASGWFGRAQRLLEEEQRECVERGYLLLADAQQQIVAGDLDAAFASAAGATGIGERFGEQDLVATARHLLGRIRLEQGQVREGLSLLDEAMVAATGGELSPVVTGLVYCSVIEGCQEVYAFGRAREWTSALAEWCERQPEMVAFTGVCSVHRAEVLQLHGAWSDALAQAERAATRCLGTNRSALAAALYQQGEVHRLRGELAAAEQAYRRASECGLEPQPGLALLRLAEQRADAAAASIRCVLGATTNPSRRARLLPARVEIALATGAVEEARGACEELAQLARHFDSPVLRGFALHAQGAIHLAEGDPSAALGELRRAERTWQTLEFPHLAARARVLVAACCRALEDEDGCRLELAAAKAAFERLGASGDLALLETKAAPRSRSTRRQALTDRELEVLRLVAAGKTNKSIAADLALSEKTVERHVSNIFGKLEVRSRAAATAYAYRRRLI